jgi:hypothetical protein
MHLPVSGDEPATLLHDLGDFRLSELAKPLNFTAVCSAQSPAGGSVSPCHDGAPPSLDEKPRSFRFAFFATSGNRAATAHHAQTDQR